MFYGVNMGKQGSKHTGVCHRRITGMERMVACFGY